MSVELKEKVNLGELLLNYNLITEEQFKKAKTESEVNKKDIRETLIELKYTNEAAINYVLSSYLDLPYVHISPQIVDPAVVKSIPAEILRRYRMLPIIRVGDKLNLVIADPMDTAAIHEAETITGCSIKISIGLTEEIMDVINQMFEKEMPEISKPSGEEILIDTSGVVFVYQYLTEALAEGATHIYLEPTRGQIGISYRKSDGRLERKKSQPLSIYPAVCSRLKIMANMDIEKVGIFQEKNILSKIGDKEVYLRISLLPSIQGDCWTIKIGERGKSCPRLENLCLTDNLLPQIKSAINQKAGLILITGPAGSGKTTTAYALLSEVDCEKKKVVTIEDVVSYQNDDFIQIESSGLSALEAALTQAADLVMVEDISEDQLLKYCFNTAVTGKLILGQMAYPYVFTLLNHLLRIGLEPSLLASTLLMVIAQRKIRLLCDKCKESYTPPPVLNIGNIPIYQPRGCEKCNFTGYQGTSYLYEILMFNERLKFLLNQGEELKKIEEEAGKEGFCSIKELLNQKLMSGIIGLEEVV